ncbi:MAG: cupin domain-containing protein [Novosphingobium sp.]
MYRLIALFAVAATTPATAQTPPQNPAPSVPVEITKMEVPQDKGPQVVHVQEREFAPGATSGWHIHPGEEIAYLISGEMELMTPTGTRHLKPGDSFVMPRGEAHNGHNSGSVNAKLVITLVVDRDAPARQPVKAP